MDEALKLRLAFEKNETLSHKEITRMLTQSLLVQKLTREFVPSPFFVLFRLVALGEIPYAAKLPYTEKLLDYANEHFVTEEGFSYTGKVEDIVPCYNALLLETYTRLGLADSPEVEKAIMWIKNYQVFQRNQKTTWPHAGICKFGGCMKATPCYIGIGKTIRGLLTYQEFTRGKGIDVSSEITRGLDYMKQHHFYQRLSNQQPISPHITDFMFPQNYALSLTDLTYIVGKSKLWQSSDTQPLQALLKEKLLVTGGWKLDYIYQHKGYCAFDSRRKASTWLSHLLPLWISEKF